MISFNYTDSISAPAADPNYNLENVEEMGGAT